MDLQQLDYSLRDLKILIVSTPKTGNTWLRHLLAAIYDLPIVKLGFPFGPEAASALGKRWIMHQHYTPEPMLLDWAKRNDVVLITTIRHPGDVLLSLYHYVHSYNERLDFYQLAELAEDDGTFGAPVRSVLRTIFKDIVALSVAWLSISITHVVAYEALYYDPVDTLIALTNALHPTSRDCIERAVESCDIREMRAIAQDNRAFFRQGIYGNWRQVLPPDIVDFLRTTEPYPAQFAALGYTLDAQDKWSAAAAKRPPAKASFFEQFGHSPATTSLLKSIYLSYDSSAAQRRWPNIAQASVPTSFHTWLNQPADTDPYAPAAPLITNIAAHIHRLRTHLNADFPDLYGQDRADFVFWLLEHATRAYHLDDTYIAPLRQGFNEWVAMTWATEPDTNDPAHQLVGDSAEHADLPILTYLARYIYRRRFDLRTTFPDLYGQHRIDFVRWFLEYAARDYNLAAACIAPLRQAFTNWAARMDEHDPAAHVGDAAYPHTSLPILTNLATYVYHQRPDLRAAYPDLYGQHRIDIVRWLIAHAADEYNVERACVEPLRQAFTNWAAQMDEHDPAAHVGDAAYPHTSLPILTNLAAYVYRQRPDLRAAYPDLYGQHRIDFLLWVVDHAASEYQLDDGCIAPLRRHFLAWALHASPKKRNSLARQSSVRYDKYRSAYLSQYLLAQKQRTPLDTVIRSLNRFLLRL